MEQIKSVWFPQIYGCFLIQWTLTGCMEFLLPLLCMVQLVGNKVLTAWKGDSKMSPAAISHNRTNSNSNLRWVIKPPERKRRQLHWICHTIKTKTMAAGRNKKEANYMRPPMEMAECRMLLLSPSANIAWSKVFDCSCGDCAALRYRVAEDSLWSSSHFAMILVGVIREPAWLGTLGVATIFHPVQF